MSSETLIREVDEELRRDRMRSFWRQFAPLIIGVPVLIVLGVAGYEGWTWWTSKQAAESSDQFYAAAELADGSDAEAARKALDQVITQGSGGYPALARFREASLLAQGGKIDEAVAAYDALSTSETDPHLRELALVLAGNLLVEKGDVAAVQQRVQGSLLPTSPLRNAAREAMGLAQYKAGNLDAAAQSFQQIIDDPLADRDLQNRVQIYVLQLQAEGATLPSASSAEPASEAPAEPSAPASLEPQASAAVDANTELDVTPPAVAEPSAPLTFTPSTAP